MEEIVEHLGINQSKHMWRKNEPVLDDDGTNDDGIWGRWRRVGATSLRAKHCGFLATMD
jgi:hypothetical protein